MEHAAPAPRGERPLRRDENEKKLAQRVHDLINETRAQHGRRRLAWDGDLAGVARVHSRDMAKGGFFSHVNRQGRNPTHRAKEAGYICEKEIGQQLYVGVAENLFITGLYSRWARVRNASGEVSKRYYWKSGEDVAREVVTGWMESKGHRQNLLNGMHESEGIGIVITSDFRVFVTQNLC